MATQHGKRADPRVLRYRAYPLVSQAVPNKAASANCYNLVESTMAMEIMTALLALSVWIGNALAALPTHIWLAVSISGFVVGWVLQFIGHVFEGRKPAFIDDIMSLAIGPLFIVVEALFACGLLPQLKAELHARAATH
jgi:uncharacterized membrane protein YGL010W